MYIVGNTSCAIVFEVVTAIVQRSNKRRYRDAFLLSSISLFFDLRLLFPFFFFFSLISFLPARESPFRSPPSLPYPSPPFPCEFPFVPTEREKREGFSKTMERDDRAERSINLLYTYRLCVTSIYSEVITEKEMRNARSKVTNREAFFLRDSSRQKRNRNKDVRAFHETP